MPIGHIESHVLLIKNSPGGQLVQFVALISQFKQGEPQGEQRLLTESLKV